MKIKESYVVKELYYSRNIIGKRIKEAREKRGLTQHALGKMCGVNTTLINDYEKGKILPGAVNIVKFVLALRFNANWLLGLTLHTFDIDDDLKRS